MWASGSTKSMRTGISETVPGKILRAGCGALQSSGLYCVVVNVNIN